MNTHADKTQENKNRSMTVNDSKKQNINESNFSFTDNRAETTMQRNVQKMANSSTLSSQEVQLQAIASSYSNNIIQAKGIEEEELLQGKFNTIQKQSMEEEELLQGKFETVQMVEDEELLQGKSITIQKQSIEEEELLQGKFETVQKKENNTGLPDDLKSGIENQSGLSIDDVKVHYNSDKPAQLNAHAYAQGTDIHVAPGQEKHLPHEAWHVVQQKQGRVKPTMQMKGNVNVNDDEGLEKEADVMGAKALQMAINPSTDLVQKKNMQNSARTNGIVQKMTVRNGIVNSVLSPTTQVKHVEPTATQNARATNEYGSRTFVTNSADITGIVDADAHNFTEALGVKSDPRFDFQANVTVSQYMKTPPNLGAGQPVVQTINNAQTMCEIGVIKNGVDAIQVTHFKKV
jgi:hypothetical protein